MGATRERLGMRRQATEDAWPPLDPLGAGPERKLADRLRRPRNRRVFLCIGAYIFCSGRAAASGSGAHCGRASKGACGSLRLPVNSACSSGRSRHAHARGIGSRSGGRSATSSLERGRRESNSCPMTLGIQGSGMRLPPQAVTQGIARQATPPFGPSAGETATEVAAVSPAFSSPSGDGR